MSQSTAMQLESDLDSDLLEAPTGLTNHARLIDGNKPAYFNAVKHGLTAQNIFLTFEDFPLYLQMGLAYMRELKPVGVRETANAQLIFESRWRTNRIMSVESGLFIYQQPLPPEAGPDLVGKSMPRQARKDRQVNAFREDPRQIDLISRYESRLIRNAARLTQELKEMRRERAAESPDLVFDAETSPAVMWYLKALAVFAKLKKARQESEEYEAARKAAEAREAVSDEPQPAENKPQTPFRKNPQPDPRPSPTHTPKTRKRAA
jgi:hypothetical protein